MRNHSAEAIIIALAEDNRKWKGRAPEPSFYILYKIPAQNDDSKFYNKNGAITVCTELECNAGQL